MSDIFLSYAIEDLQRVRPIVQALKQRGWSVWWDRLNILPGNTFDEVIEDALEAARCVVVVWSEASVASHWVRDGADEGRNRLVPVVIDEIRPPLGFRRIQAARLTDWSGTEPHEEFDKFVRALTDLLGQPPQDASRQTVVEVPDIQVSDISPARTEEPVPIGDVGSSFDNSMGMAFVLIPSGEFQMGSEHGENNERPVHTVRISQPYCLGRYAVTQGEWEAVMGNNPSHFTGDPNRPVEQVSWEDVQAFIGKLNEREGSARYRLPTEAEWEYAARAGTPTAYSFGDDPGRLDEYGWYSGNSGDKTHAVGELKANAWGLYDMHGNVWEWVQDWYSRYTAESVTDPVGPVSGSARVHRGGGWNSPARDCRSAPRTGWPPGNRYHGLGFRLLRAVE